MIALRLSLASAAMLGLSAFQIGDQLVTSSGGAPICADQEELQEYLLAAIKQDERWMKSLRSCFLAKEGLDVVVLENLPSDTDIGNFVKVRLFSPIGRSSVVGYTVSFSLEKK